MATTTYLSCPFSPVLNVINSWDLRFLDDSCQNVEQIGEYDYGGGPMFGVPGFDGGYATFVLTPSNYVERYDDFFDNPKSQFTFTFYFNVPYPTPAVWRPSAAAMDAIFAEIPTTINFGESMVVSINTSHLVAYQNGQLTSTPFPTDRSITDLYSVVVANANDYFSITGVEFVVVPHGEPTANIFWTANKGCTEMP